MWVGVGQVVGLFGIVPFSHNIYAYNKPVDRTTPTNGWLWGGQEVENIWKI